jgi:hypothetical protein
VTTRRKREGYERVAAEEEEREREQEQEHANRHWRRMSRSEPRRPTIITNGENGGNANGNGTGNGNGNGSGTGNENENGSWSGSTGSHPADDE